MNCIAAVDKNWAIGKENDLLISIPEDMKFFRKTTLNKTVVMGRKTLESFPGGNPLKNRVNIVFTRDKNYSKDGIICVHSIDELTNAIQDIPSEDVFVIGGGSIYKLLIDMCDTAYITKIDHSFDADTYFPNLDEMTDWKIDESSDIFEHEGMHYAFVKYKRI